MRNLKTIVGVILVTISSFVFQEITAQQDISIIPKPANVVVKEGKFEFSKNTRFVVTDASQKEMATALINKFEMAAGWKPQLSAKIPKSNFIQFKIDKNLNREAYKLDISTKSIVITAKENAGFMYGLESIRQLLPTAIESKKIVSSVKWQIPNVSIKDEPSFLWRGFMLDITRHFFDKTYIKATIDRLAMHKMNVLHLHLVDDQGWRIEIKKYPKLTQVGAYRNGTIVGHYPGTENDNKTYGCFLTQEDIKEIVAYATKKNITIVPEIELPGHASAAIASYPYLSCFPNEPTNIPFDMISTTSKKLQEQGQPKIVQESWGVFKDIYCAGKEDTFGFLEDVLAEIMPLFPSQYIHIGGDEAIKTNWEMCPNCQKRMKDEGLKDVHELQSYFVKRIEKFVNSKGKKIIGWDEILEGGLAPDASVMSWRGVKGGIEAAEQGHDVVMTPGTHCYFDHYQGPQNLEPLAFGGYIPLSKVYEFNPVVATMTPKEAQHILGGQANLWSEYIPTTQQSEYMIFPRIAAMSEALWSSKEIRNWNDFTQRLPSLLMRYDYLGINYAKSASLITASYTAHTDKKNIKITLKNEFPNTDIRYVLGNANFNNAIQYTDSIPIQESTIIKASLFENNKAVGKVFTDTIVFHKGFGSKINYTIATDASNLPPDNFALVNGIRGTKNYNDPQWQTWSAKDMDVIIDLGKKENIAQVVVGSLENQWTGVYFPTEINVSISNDGITYKKVGTLVNPFAVNPIFELKDFKINFNKQLARYIKVKATHLKKSPEGEEVRLNIDEILVN